MLGVSMCFGIYLRHMKTSKLVANKTTTRSSTSKRSRAPSLISSQIMALVRCLATLNESITYAQRLVDAALMLKTPLTKNTSPGELDKLALSNYMHVGPHNVIAISRRLVEAITTGSHQYLSAEDREAVIEFVKVLHKHSVINGIDTTDCDCYHCLVRRGEINGQEASDVDDYYRPDREAETKFIDSYLNGNSDEEGTMSWFAKARTECSRAETDLAD